MKQMIVLIGAALLCMGVAGCETGKEAETDEKKREALSPKVSDEPNVEYYYSRKLYFKDIFQSGLAYQIVNGSWQTFMQSSEGVDMEITGVYQRYRSGIQELVDCRDSVRTVAANIRQNDYGSEVVADGLSETPFWLVYVERDTLYYTSPEYPPRVTWKARRIKDSDFESVRLSVQYPGYLSGVNCLPEAAREEGLYRIDGVWKLVKDVDGGTDYSCDNVTWHFPAYADGALAVTSDRPDYPSGVYAYTYINEGACPACLPLKANYRLTIDGTPVYAEVLEDKMFIRDDAITHPSPATRFFVRIK